MNETIRGALGVLCAAAFALVISLGARSGDNNFTADVAQGIATLLALFGLGLLVFALLRPRR